MKGHTIYTMYERWKYGPRNINIANVDNGWSFATCAPTSSMSSIDQI